jgi:hypothetical protein
MSMERMSDWAALVAGVGVAAIGLYVVVSQGVKLAPYRNSGDWPTVSGTIETSQLEWRKGGERVAPITSPDRLTKPYRKGVKLVAVIRYRYAVEGKKYVNSRVTADKTGDPRRVVAQFEEGRTVTIHYDPARPKRAVLVPGFTRAAIVPILLSAVVGIFGAVMAIHTGRLLARTSPKRN